MQTPTCQSSPLAFAAFVGNVKAIRLCMSFGRWHGGCIDSALLYGALLGHVEIVNILLDQRHFSALTLERAFSCALLQDHLEICRSLARHTESLHISLEDVDQLVQLDRKDALELCLTITDETSLEKIFSFRAFQMACLCECNGVVQWFVEHLESGACAPDPNLLLAVLRVQSMHVWVRRMLPCLVVSPRILEYVKDKSFSMYFPMCTQLVCEWNTKRRWRQVRGLSNFVVVFRRWLADYYSPTGKGFCQAKISWSKQSMHKTYDKHSTKNDRQQTSSSYDGHSPREEEGQAQ